MDPTQSNNVTQMQRLTPLEERVIGRWYNGDLSAAYARGVSMPGARRFYVASGDYTQRKTKDLADSLRDLCDRGRHNSPAAKALARELASRRRGIYGAKPSGPDNGPEAA